MRGHLRNRNDEPAFRLTAIVRVSRVSHRTILGQDADGTATGSIGRILIALQRGFLRWPAAVSNRRRGLSGGPSLGPRVASAWPYGRAM